MRLSVVVPVYNERTHVGETIRSVRAAAASTGFELELLVVDDGSTDDTAGTAAAAVGDAGRVIRQENAGRFAARRAGLGAATGELVLFLDGRVLLDPQSLAFLEQRVAEGELVWNGHVHIDGSTLYGRFWTVLTELAFSDYFASPRTTSFDAASFDRYPKGTTCFAAPAELLRDAFARHRTVYRDERNANDDTPIIRSLAERTPIHISPSFACTYRPRTTLRGFVRHALHRGVVFLDGHGRRGSRFLPLVVAFYPVSAALVVLAFLRPLTALWAVALGILAAAATAAARGRRPAEIVSFGLLAPVYAVAHGLGMWRGAALALAGRRR